jgi:uncharacterized spore protein YtfJ
MDAKELQDMVTKARDAITVKRVYGQPYERDGVTVIPAAAVSGGGGGGAGEDAQKGGKGGGGGFGVNARPVGAYVIENGNVRWVPARDLTQLLQRTLAALPLIALVLLRFRRKG